jgi:signal transduction histidine kinase/CheY-like chemotaxis protein
MRARLTLLAEADLRLTQSFDAARIADELAGLVAREGRPCSVHLLSEGVLKTAASVPASGKSPTPADLRLSDPDDSISRAVRTGKSQLSERASSEGARVCVAVLPLVVHDEVVGVLEVETRPLREDEVVFLEMLCHRAAVALDQIRLVRSAEESRWAAELQAEYAKRLQSVTFGLSEAMTARQMGAIVVREAIDAMGGHVAGVVQVSEHAPTLETIASAGIPEDLGQRMNRPVLGDCLPMTSALNQRTELFFESAAEWVCSYPGLEGGVLPNVHALACLPLTLAGGRAVGVLFLGFAYPHRFLQTERAFLRTLAQQLAQVLDRARLFEAEHRMRLSAEEANRSKDEFLSVVSHELRTPLTAILGWAHVLRDPRHDATKRDRAIEIIERNALAQTRIIEDILDVSRIVTGKLRLQLRETDLLQVVSAAIEVVRPAANAKGVHLQVRVGRVPRVAGDPERLQQILWNLLSNAIRFTPRDRSVAVVVEHAGLNVRVVVSDEGDGIEPSFLPRVFDRFRQGDSSAARRHGGLGLGLAIVRHLVELHGGSVSAQSEGPGRGAVFTILLPVPPAEPAVHKDQTVSPTASGEARPQASTAPLDDLRILLVEDDPDTRDAYTELLTSCNAVVRSVGSADTAVHALDEFRPDILISDIGLPGEDGFALLARVRALRSPNADVPAIALTAFAGQKDARQARKAGFFAHLVKPIELGQLSAALAAAHRTRAHP